MKKEECEDQDITECEDQDHDYKEDGFSDFGRVTLYYKCSKCGDIRTCTLAKEADSEWDD